MPELATSRCIECPIEQVRASAFKISTGAPESDGTYEWDSTTLVVAEITAAGEIGLGYTYADKATAILITDHLADVLSGHDAVNVNGIWRAMVASIRNLGRPGIASMAVSALDIALWDLKAKILQSPLATLLGKTRERVPAYGSGGFTSYSLDQLQRQLGDWAESGMQFVKMKIGREPSRDLERIKAARSAIGKTADLFVDANGAYGRKEALRFAETFADYGVTWFEEPVSSDDLDGLHFIRQHAPAKMEIAAGEYGYDSFYFRRMLQAGAVDVLQADATRCAGITGFMQTASLCNAFSVPLSAHTAPTVHTNVCCGVAADMRHIEYFHDHERIEHMFFEGASTPIHGQLHPNSSEPGLGIVFKRRDASPYEI